MKIDIFPKMLRLPYFPKVKWENFTLDDGVALRKALRKHYGKELKNIFNY